MINSLKNFWNDRPTAREFIENVCYGIAMVFAAAAGAYGFYLLTVLILLLEPVY
tara:strand:- start:209 stop:370 length:162 start_codon:yes stop_codon:yes gene_type:complete